MFLLTSINDSFVLCFFVEKCGFSQGLCRKTEGGAVSCSLHAVVIRLCGGKFYCFPLVLSQSNNLLRCPRSLSPVSFMYNSFFRGHFWSVSAMLWMGERAVCQPLRLRPCNSLRQLEGGWGGALHFGVLNWMATGQWLGQPPATDVTVAFLVSTPSACMLSHGTLLLRGNRKSQHHPSIFQGFLCSRLLILTHT